MSSKKGILYGRSPSWREESNGVYEKDKTFSEKGREILKKYE